MSIRHLCEWLEDKRACYFAKHHGSREPAKLAEEVALCAAMEQLILDGAGYGYRHMTQALQLAGWQVNHKHVQRVRREESLT